jgi:hypothetical protein
MPRQPSLPRFCYCISRNPIRPGIVYVTKQTKNRLEITPAMIEAGVDVLCDFDPDGGVSFGKLASSIFGAMITELPRPNVFEYGPNLIAEIEDLRRQRLNLVGGERLETSEQEREDEVLRRLLKTQPKPHTPPKPKPERPDVRPRNQA